MRTFCSNSVKKDHLQWLQKLFNNNFWGLIACYQTEMTKTIIHRRSRAASLMKQMTMESRSSLASQKWYSARNHSTKLGQSMDCRERRETLRLKA